VAARMNDDLSPTPGMFRKDLAVLTKVRLNTFVLVTTFFGYFLGAKTHGWDWMQLFHTLLGTAAAAFGSAAFNQLMEIDLDARMARTADRPLPSKRMDVLVAFVIGVLLSAFGLVHLSVMVNKMTAVLALITLVTYVFLYTPMKRKHSANTLIGAIPGAIPPMIGWTAAGGALDESAWFLFALLFLWQLPHFIAINWMCREEYESAGYRMWSNGDVSGVKSARLCLWFSACLMLLPLWPYLSGLATLPWLVCGILLGVRLIMLSRNFGQAGDRASARRLFLFTLLYLPAALTVLAVCWKGPGAR
jgi:protoheme IX farnesyltransferase